MNVQTWPRTRAEHRKLISYLARKTGDVHVAEDLAQDVMVRLLAFMKRVEVAQPRALAFRIADNLTINWARRSRVRLERPLSDCDPASALDIEREFLRREKLELVRAAMRDLPPKQREVMTRRQLHGESAKEIAQAMDISHASVEKHLTRGVASVRMHVQRRAAGPSPCAGAALCVVKTSRK
jgi:RNA polymerase sigma-70 factor (ECF subfamily)